MTEVTDQAVGDGGDNPNEVIERSDIRRLFWRSFLLQAAFNYERFQNMGWWWGIKPLLRKLYGHDALELAKADQRHLVFFNTHPWMVGPVFGVVAQMEERRARGETEIDDDSISSVKVSMMGPLAGMGDSLIFGAIRPVLSGVTAGLAVTGNVLAPILFLVGINIVHFVLRWYGLVYGSRYGATFFERLDPEQVERVKDSATTVGLLVAGALVSSFIAVNTPLEYASGEQTVQVQNILNQVLPGVIPLAVTLGLYGLLRKGIGPTWLLLGTAVIGVVAGAFGVLAPAG